MRERLLAPEVMVKRLIPIVFALYAPMAFADEHLVPEDNQYSRAALPNGQGSLAPYYEKVLALMGQAYTPDVRARVIVMPESGPEYATGIREREGAYSVFHIALKSQIWQYENLDDVRDLDLDAVAQALGQQVADAIAELKASLPDDYHDVQSETCEFAIEPVLGQKIVDLWHKMLLRTHFATAREVGPAGTDYHFSMRGNTQQLSGKSWEPPADSEAGRLVAVAKAMKDLCVSGDAKLVDGLRPKVDDALARLGG